MIYADILWGEAPMLYLLPSIIVSYDGILPNWSKQKERRVISFSISFVWLLLDIGVIFEIPIKTKNKDT